LRHDICCHKQKCCARHSPFLHRSLHIHSRYCLFILFCLFSIFLCNEMLANLSPWRSSTLSAPRCSNSRHK
jgi:integral membrane sensor domain MASE1